MTHVTIIGGHGNIALLLAPELHASGHQVTSIFRNPDHQEDVAQTGATPVVADIAELSVEEIAALLNGQEAVVWSAGAGGGSPERTYAVDREAAIRTMDAAESAGVKRFVMVSYLGAGQDHGVPEDDPFHAYAQAKADADLHLRASDLDWTILGPGLLTFEGPSGTIAVDPETGTGSGHTSRANVALVAAHVLADPLTIKRTIDFADGDTPIEQALSSLT